MNSAFRNEPATMKCCSSVACTCRNGWPSFIARNISPMIAAIPAKPIYVLGLSQSFRSSILSSTSILPNEVQVEILEARRLCRHRVQIYVRVHDQAGSAPGSGPGVPSQRAHFHPG